MTARVLVVEDNPANMKLAVLLLEHAGYEVLRADNADDGIAAARADLPDMILMDIQLPGMDGLQATRVLKADPATRAIKVIALTAFAMKGDEERIRTAGCDGYIAKPIEYKSFLAEVARQLKKEADDSMKQTTSRKLLVVDDDPHNRKLLETLLRSEGFTVRHAVNGFDALESVAADPPDAILLDLMMPDMDGFEVARRLRADPVSCNIPIIMVTALDDEASRARLTATGIDAALTKPVDRWLLKERLEQLLGGNHP